MSQVPEFLQNYQKRTDLMEAAAAGLGGLLPPRITIGGNVFTLVDASGSKRVHAEILTNGQGQKVEQPAKYLDICVVDISSIICKMYFGEKYQKGDEDPPLCWSSNGIGPSREALEPAAATCAVCPHNVRGSEVSALSGAAIKACRDEKYLAVILPLYPEMLFRLVLTPGSFKNWRAYEKRYEGQQYDMSVFLTRVWFEEGKNGVLQFDIAGWLDKPLYERTRAALAEKKTDLICGRLDQPRQIALPSPVPPASQNGATQNWGNLPAAVPAGTPVQAAPAEEPKQRRRRRTKEEMARDEAAKQAPAAPFRPLTPENGSIPVPDAEQSNQASLPFSAAPGPAGGAPPAFQATQPSFAGMAPGVPPNAELASTLAGLFPK